jgi:hypothetical protein
MIVKKNYSFIFWVLPDDALCDAMDDSRQIVALALAETHSYLSYCY